MWSISIPVTPATIEQLTTDLWEMGTAGIVEEPKALRAFFEDSISRESVYSKLAATLADTRDEVPFDTSQAIPIECDPILIGQRFFVAPSWVNNPTPAGRIRLTIDTTNAFGSGRHESTQLCMEVLEKHLKPGSFVADIGCGSGILSAAALALGARAVISCDIHESSILTARSFLRTPMFIGSADGLRNHTFNLVVANLSLRVLDVVARDLQRITKPDGTIAIAGFLHENPPKYFKRGEAFRKGDWACWVCRPEDIDAPASPTEPAAHTQQWWL